MLIKSILVLVVVILAAVAGLVLVGEYEVSAFRIVQVLTGNFLIDALFELWVTAPVLLPAALLCALALRWFVGISMVSGLLLSLAVAYAVIFFVYVLSQFTIPLLPILYDVRFQYIRASVGAGFLASLFSILLSLRSDVPRRFPFVRALIVVLPLVAVPILLLSLDVNGITWAHFDD
ncbi:hypothetical protein [Candidatus Thiosymbion oneisti]|uniref:hypothetical protein n=1 Tax=Candidatus Thiosymbion oneisti TaxID=589554 RepID=UPI000B7F5E06|nr:hypothetical protein [Candidatus Thiosymbion oneisti]